MRQRTFGFHKMKGIFLLNEDLLAFQEGLELDVWLVRWLVVWLVGSLFRTLNTSTPL